VDAHGAGDRACLCARLRALRPRGNEDTPEGGGKLSWKWDLPVAEWNLYGVDWQVFPRCTGRKRGTLKRVRFISTGSFFGGGSRCGSLWTGPDIGEVSHRLPRGPGRPRACTKLLLTGRSAAISSSAGYVENSSEDQP